MAFKSEAQRRKFKEMVVSGKITQDVFDEWHSGTPCKLPDRIKHPAPLKIKTIKEIRSPKK